LKTIIKNTEIKKNISFHCSRHTFAVRQIRAGTDIHTLSKLLGHSSINMTEKYLHLADLDKQTAFNNLPELTLNLYIK
jgi:site-specific recombinase XerD